MNRILSAALVLMLCGCAANQPPATSPAAKPSNFKNVQVLPRDMPREELINIMKGFSRSLGVRCDACHVVVSTDPKLEFDFPADTKEEKRIARVMIQMTQQINHQWMDRVEAVEDKPAPGAAEAEEDEGVRVACWTCHRGKKQPEMPPPPQPEPPAGAGPAH